MAAEPYARYASPTASKGRPQPRKKTTKLEIFLFVLFAVLLIGAIFAFVQQFTPHADFVPPTVAAGFKRDRINLLLIGIAGDRKIDGGNDLADAIMLVSLKPSTKQAALISIPRDFYLKIGHFGIHRLNAAHDLGYKMGYRGGGPGLLMDTVSQITGQPIDGYARLDFKAFEKIIDDLGGIDIYVYRPFHDYLFNDTFQAGWQHMNGDRALRYARYRYVLGLEGTNFARELRQQQVISAVKKKVQHMSFGQAMHLLGSATTVSGYTTTNLSTGDLVDLYRAFHDIPPQNIRHVSLAPLTEVFDVTNPADPGQAVRPKGGSAAPIQAAIRDVFKDMRPLVLPTEIQLTDSGTPQPSYYAGDDTLKPAARRTPATH